MIFRVPLYSSMMRYRIYLTLGAFVYGLSYLYFYLKYMPQVPGLRIIVTSLIVLILVVTSLSVKAGTLNLIFLVPIASSIPYFFSVSGVNPLLFLFYSYLFGVLIHQIVHPQIFRFKDDIFLPIIVAALVCVISFFVTFWRYTNFFPCFDSSIQEWVVNCINVSSGGSIRRVIFDTLAGLAGFIWFGILVNILKRKEIARKAILYLAVSTIFSLGFGFYQVFVDMKLGNLDIWVRKDRINALFADPNSLGIFLVLSLPLFGGAFLVYKKPWRFIFLFPLVGGICLFPHIGSRSGFIGLFLSTLFFLFLLEKRFLNKQKKRTRYLKRPLTYLIISFILIGIISSMFLFFRDSILAQRLDQNVKDLIRVDEGEKIFEGRKYFWTAAMYMVREFPLSGIGIGSFTVELPNFYKKHDIYPVKPFTFYQKKPGQGVLIDTTGNMYFHIVSELGLIGLCIFGWIYILILLRIKDLIFPRGRISSPDYLNAGLISSILSMFLIFLLGAHLLSFDVQLTFWLIVGFLYALSPHHEKKDKSLKSKTIWLGLVVLVFFFSLLWNSIHSLSIERRTEEFDLVHNFGLYHVERMDGKKFNWTGDKAGMTLRINKPLLVIPILASNPDIEINPVRVKIYLTENLMTDKNLLDEIILDNNVWQDFRYDLSKKYGKKALLVFEVSRTWQPSIEIGTKDTRHLGIAIGEVNFVDLYSADGILWSENDSLIHKFSISEWEGCSKGVLNRKGKCWSDEFDLPSGQIKVIVRAKGTKAKEEWPYMIVRFGENVIGGDWVESEDWKAYYYYFEHKNGKNRISVEFINDHYDVETREDRNLFVGDVDVVLLR